MSKPRNQDMKNKDALNAEDGQQNKDKGHQTR
jgi:hypothetical protein